jgi:hypothetical protein
MIDRLPKRIADRIQVEPMTGCWLWVGHVGSWGYGQVFWNRRMRMSHCAIYEILVGPIPVGMQLDHVKARGCATPSCCNPDHLEPVTPRENSRRSTSIPAEQGRRTHCARGHELGGDNAYAWRTDRRCRECNRINSREWKERKRQEKAEATS